MPKTVILACFYQNVIVKMKAAGALGRLSKTSPPFLRADIKIVLEKYDLNGRVLK